jgi:hypothetical protein
MLTTTRTLPLQARRPSEAKKALPQPAGRGRVVPQLDSADKSVFEAIASSPQFTLDKFKKLAAR